MTLIPFCVQSDGLSMIDDLDRTIARLLCDKAPTKWELASAAVTFDVPDARWRGQVTELTVNCYLYEIKQNTVLRTREPLVQRSTDGRRASRREPPVRIDCAYCITAWSPAASEPVAEEHRLLSQIMWVLLRNPTIPFDVLQGSLAEQIPPYPTVMAQPDGVKNQADFWGALDQQLKPSLNYVITLAMLLDEQPVELGNVVKQVQVQAHHRSQ